MKKVVLFAIFVLGVFVAAGCSSKGGSTFVKQIKSDYNITATADKFATALAPKEYKRVQDLDLTTIAKKKKMYLKPTISYALSNPIIDSKLLECNPSLGIDLPIRITVSRDLSGQVTLYYTSPEYLSSKHNIKDKNCLGLIKIMARDLDEATDAILKSKKAK